MAVNILESINIVFGFIEFEGIMNFVIFNDVNRSYLNEDLL